MKIYVWLLDEEGRLAVSATYYYNISNLTRGLILKERYASFFNRLSAYPRLSSQIYVYQNGVFKTSVNTKEIELLIAEEVDKTPFNLPRDYNLTSLDFVKKQQKTIDDLSPEELNEIATPIPTPNDFPTLPTDLVERDFYKEVQGIEFEPDPTDSKKIRAVQRHEVKKIKKVKE